jgi:hypothetical protein
MTRGDVFCMHRLDSLDDYSPLSGIQSERIQSSISEESN